MKNWKLSAFWVAAALVVSSTGAPPAAAQSAYIQKIEIEGNREVSDQKIRRVLRFERGARFDAEKVQEALKRLFATKQFKDLRAYVDTGARPDSLTLIVEVEEYPKIDELRFEGNKHVDDDDLTKATEVNKGSFIRPSLLSKDFDAISELYKEKGYYRVQVRDSMFIDQKTKERVLMYVVAEGEKVSVKHVDFFGARDIDTDEIRKVMSTKEDRWFRGADFKPKEFEQDDTKILNLYKSRGYLDIEIKDKDLVFSDDGKDLDIFITLDEGKQYRVGGIKWHGNELFADSVITPLVTLKRGEPFDEIELSQIQFNIGSLFWNKGYIYSNVAPVKDVRGDTVDVDFDITQGNLAHVKEINIVGNTKTSEEVIRRELVLIPGDVFASGKLQRSLREVFRLGFFAGPPQVNTNPANEQGDIDVTLRVEEKPAGQFRMGAGFSQLNKVSGFIGVSEPNFLGKGLRVGLDWEFSKYRQNINVSFTDPWFRGTPTEVSVSVFNRVQNQVSQQFYSDRRRGASLRVGRPFPWFDYTSVFGSYRLEEVELNDFSAGYTGTLRDIDWPQATSSLGMTIVRNSTDNPFHPTQGTRTVLTSRWTGGDLLGGDVRFQRYEAKFSWYQALLWKFVLEVRDDVGILDGYDSPDQVPDYELYRLGGNRTNALRGYDFYEVVPEGNQQYVGGRFKHVLSYEVSFPIAPPTVYGLFFYDAGNTWNSFREADPFDLKRGAGLGIRIELPMLGTIGMDYGYGFDRLGGASWEPHITFGGGF
jgi:outer membrane protein insertion porin family